jgi:3-deoxy-7-phosphoheptulonate synthase
LQAGRLCRRTSDINVVETRVLPSPAELLAELPKTEAQAEFVTRAREEIHRLIFTDDKRFLLIVGPCSIHDLAAGRDYARRLAALAREVADRVMIVMRVYFEKPRTTVGWKGLIMDPHLDGSHDIAAGLRLARTFLRDVLDLGLPTATELLDPSRRNTSPTSSAGPPSARARPSRRPTGRWPPASRCRSASRTAPTAPSQTAINAIKAAGQPQTFLGINLDGSASAIVTRGNPDCHIVLRGGAAGPTTRPPTSPQTEQLLAKAGLPKSILVDCSHDNSAKQPERQPEVMRELLPRSPPATPPSWAP